MDIKAFLSQEKAFVVSGRLGLWCSFEMSVRCPVISFHLIFWFYKDWVFSKVILARLIGVF